MEKQSGQTLSDTAVFVAVIEAGSFTGAAETLGLSKGAVSKYVSRLEADLGVRLINRTTRRLTLTEAGATYHARAASALAALAEAGQAVSDEAGNPRGHLRISAPTFYGAEVLGPRLCEFRRAYPEISIELSLENRFVDLVAERFDVAIRMSAPTDSSLVMRKLAEVPMVVCASPAYLAEHGRPETVEDLRHHECLIYTVVAKPGVWVFPTKGGRRIAVQVQGRLHTDDDHVQRQAAIDGFGILRMPKIFVQSALDQGLLEQVWPDADSPNITLGAVYPSRHAVPAKVRAFVSFLAGERSP